MNINTTYSANVATLLPSINNNLQGNAFKSDFQVFHMDNIKHILDAVIEENRALVEHWIAGKPGSWGALAGKAIVAVTRHMNKSLTNEEKRIVWQLLWDRLVKIKAQNQNDS